MHLFEHKEAVAADSANQRRQLLEVQGMGAWQAMGCQAGDGGQVASQSAAAQMSCICRLL